LPQEPVVIGKIQIRLYENSDEDITNWLASIPYRQRAATIRLMLKWAIAHSPASGLGQAVGDVPTAIAGATPLPATAGAQPAPQVISVPQEMQMFFGKGGNAVQFAGKPDASAKVAETTETISANGTTGEA
jgi:hypothetical protein